MEKELRDKVIEFAEYLQYLRERWNDEREYEDWNEYVAGAKNKCPAELKFKKLTKRPFAAWVVMPDGVECRVRVSAKDMVLEGPPRN